MGHKGVSKRKPSQTKSKPVSSDKASGSVSSVLQATENQPARSSDTGKAVTKPSTDRKKNPKKG
jgi:hypothetical protein